MKLQEFAFPELKPLEVAFSTLRTNKDLLAEAKERGFYNGSTKYNSLFSSLFFSGGQVEFKKNLNEEFKNKAWTYCRAFMGSWEPKHEEKEAICAMIMSELLEPKLKGK